MSEARAEADLTLGRIVAEFDGDELVPGQLEHGQAAQGVSGTLSAGAGAGGRGAGRVGRGQAGGGGRGGGGGGGSGAGGGSPSRGEGGGGPPPGWRGWRGAAVRPPNRLPGHHVFSSRWPRPLCVGMGIWTCSCMPATAAADLLDLVTANVARRIRIVLKGVRLVRSRRFPARHLGGKQL